MEKEIAKVAEEIGGSLADLGAETTSLTRSAILIAQISLTSFRGELLDKALNISKAIVEYESELQSQ